MTEPLYICAKHHTTTGEGKMNDGGYKSTIQGTESIPAMLLTDYYKEMEFGKIEAGR